MTEPQDHNIVSVSGGKDSTALLLLAIEREANPQPVFADTGHEHQQTYDYVRYLEDATGIPIRWVKADFSADIARKRAFVAAHWKRDLMRERPGEPGEWEMLQPPSCGPAEDAERPPLIIPPPPSDIYSPYRAGNWYWHPATRPLPPLSEEEAEEWVARAVNALQPTGIPFLDLCIWKGRFPSTRARFCSEELKHVPILQQVHLPLLEAGHDVTSWQGVRADESLARRHLPEMEEKRTYPSGGTLWNYRPILKWTAEDCFAMHRKHGIKHNPLYEQGMGRVGCMPCIHARKDELLELARRFPGEIARVAEWERIVSFASKRGSSTFFEADTIPGNSREMAGINHQTHGIESVIMWAQTGRGGRQFDMFRTIEGDAPLCSSIYGLCE